MLERIMSIDRSSNDEQLKVWKKIIRRRDRRKCQFPDCHEKKKLQCHHIIRWSDCPELRYDIGNGILLCKSHHELVTGEEIIYAPIFIEIVQKRKNIYLKKNVLNVRA